MPFIGNQPAESYSAFQKQDFSTSATTSYTLDNPVANANELALFINFVRQEPTTAYSASGTTLTLTSATSASDDMYCVYLGKAVQTVNPPNASVGLSQLTASGTKDATTFLRGDNTFASAGGTMTPAFATHLSGTQSVSDNTRTKVQYNVEIFDSAGAYDNSTNYRFTPQTAGKYFVYASLSLYAGTTSAYEYGFIYIQKNTTDVAVAGADMRGANNGRWFTPSTSTIVDMNGSSDYLEVDGICGTSNSPVFYGDNHFSTFGAYKIIE